MHFSLGIDAGGTYTDAVIISDSNGEVVESSKALTTYPDPLPGMKKLLINWILNASKALNLYLYPPPCLLILSWNVPAFLSD